MAYADTPIEMCQQRDSKDMHTRARRGEAMDFTGMDDPYEPPRQPATTLTTVDHSPEENAKAIVEFLEKRGFLISS
ncbi:MAG: adenylyl-sulfate kinase [Dehalococcoidales bacterium]|jgi:sulfate adenylyltransferase